MFFVIIGMGSAMVSDILFNIYIKDKKINPVENKTLEILSRTIWISLGLIVLSGIALPTSANFSSKKQKPLFIKVFCLFPSLFVILRYN